MKIGYATTDGNILSVGGAQNEPKITEDGATAGSWKPSGACTVFSVGHDQGQGAFRSTLSTTRA